MNRWLIWVLFPRFLQIFNLWWNWFQAQFSSFQRKLLRPHLFFGEKFYISKYFKWNNTMYKVRGVLNFSAKSIRRRICHVKAYAWKVNFSALSIQSKLSCDALKFTFWHVINIFSVKISSNRWSRVKM